MNKKDEIKRLLYGENDLNKATLTCLALTLFK